jgi:Heterokaryon incompatibility protein (HET)
MRHSGICGTFPPQELSGLMLYVSQPYWVPYFGLRPSLISTGINQDDIFERENQVRVMGDIYSNAFKTILWLGEETEDVRGWAESLTKLRGYFRGDLESRLPRLEFKSTFSEDLDKIRDLILEQGMLDSSIFSAENVQDHFLMTDLWKPVVALLRRPWFQRKWVIQEVAMSRYPVISCGSQSLQWQTLQELLLAVLVMNQVGPIVAATGDGAALQGIHNATSLSRTRRYFCGHFGDHELATLLFLFSDFHCTDPRDHLNAILGLASDIDNTGGLLRPDYTVPTEKVFQSFAIWSMFERNSLDFFSWRYQNRTRSLRHPSWVPDISNVQTYQDLIPKYLHAWFSASGRSTVSAAVASDSKLVIKGKVIDQIARVGSREFVNLTPKEQEIPGWGPIDIVGRRWRAWRDECKQLAFGRSGVVKDATVFDAFWRTLVWDLDANASKRADTYYRDSVVKFLDEYLDLLSAPVGGEPSLEVGKLALALMDVTTAIVRGCERRRFGTTVNDRFVSVPNSAEVGDRICIFFGGRVPYVLRPCGKDEYILIGDCYCHGVMDGEAMTMDEYKEEDITII